MIRRLAARSRAKGLTNNHGPESSEQALSSLIAQIRVLDRDHVASRTSRQVAHRLQPFLAFVERYSSAVDVGVQGLPSPAVAIWGCLRAVLVVLRSFSQYLDKFVQAAERLGDTLSIYAQYDLILGGNGTFRQSLSLAYLDVIAYLEKSRSLFQKSGLNVLLSALWTDFEAESQDVLSQIGRRLDSLREHTTLACRRNVIQRLEEHGEVLKDLTAQVHTLRFQRQDRLRQWLSPVMVQAQFQRYRSKRIGPNGDWLFSSAQFQRWQQSRSSLLWINGPPGSGKSVLSTSIIERMSSSAGLSGIVLYFYYDFLDPASCTLHRTVATLVHQIMFATSSTSDALVGPSIQAREPNLEGITEPEALEIFRQIVKDVNHDVTIVLDGVDESIEPAKIVAFFAELLTSAACSLRVLVLSRDVPEIRSALRTTPVISLDAENVRSDIHAYLANVVPLILMQYGLNDRHDEIVARLEQSADGMFSWVNSMVEGLKAALCYEDVDEILSRPISVLDGVYSKSLQQLARKSQAEQMLIQRLALWVVSCLRPLTVGELQAALAVCPSNGVHNRARRPFAPVVQRLCSLFFQIEPQTQTVHVVHPSCKEFLIAASARDAASSPANILRVNEAKDHETIALGCLAVLHGAFESKDVLDTDSLEPVARYACQHWLDHALACADIGEIEARVMLFLKSRHRKRWIFYFLFWYKRCFPLQRLLRLREQLLDKFSLTESSLDDIPFVVEWAFDIADALPGMYSPGSHSGTNQEHRKWKTRLDGVEPIFSHFEIMMIVRDLARHFTQTKNIGAAILLFSRVLEEAQGSSHPAANVVVRTWCMNVLGILYHQNGEVDRATNTHEQVLCILGEHPSASYYPQITIWTKNELGRMYRHQGDLSRAEGMHMDALSSLLALVTDDTSGTIEQEVAWTRATLARTYRKLGRYSEAISQSHSALKVRHRLLGPRHPHSLWVQSDIAQCHLELGEHGKAVKAHREVYEVRGEVLGNSHPDTLWSMNNLGVALAAMGGDRILEATKLQQRALAEQVRVLGWDHPHTIWTRKIVEDVVEQNPSRSLGP